MTQNITIRMAQEAGLHLATSVNWMPIIGLEYAERFIAIVRAEERAACAEICDRMAARYEDMRGAALESAAESIRLRGQA